ncbi:MAG: TIM barrel protein [Litoreibacter sp.]|uniref:TIM barrel protein n=1 Tax=Litoreibacter sp. TaxID=1969459 RepID=UPI003297BED6
MLKFALNHMTTPSLTMEQLVSLADELGLVGVELRNDLAHPMFDGATPAVVANQNIPILALAEVKAFNDFSRDTLNAATALMDLAVEAGAPAIALIPKVGGSPVAETDLRAALTGLAPELEMRGLIGLIEPIGFASSSLRFKAEVVNLINELDIGGQFGLIHDTFHHALSGEGEVFPKHTKLVHISGVMNAKMAFTSMGDEDRALVEAGDRLGNVKQISELMRGGYSGPFSFEAFSPDVHALDDPKAALSRSIRFIENSVMAHAA